MIKGICRTNNDDGKREKWPLVFVAVPRIGDKIVGLSSSLKMRVLSITHKIKIEKPEYPPSHVEVGGPYIEIELGR